jgi:hypothetical protein
VDANYVRGLCRPPTFQGVRRCGKEDHLVYRQFVIEGNFKPPTKKRSEETEFSVEVFEFSVETLHMIHVCILLMMDALIALNILNLFLLCFFFCEA